jgi:hypothetical protein
MSDTDASSSDDDDVDVADADADVRNAIEALYAAPRAEDAGRTYLAVGTRAAYESCRSWLERAMHEEHLTTDATDRCDTHTNTPVRL